VVALKLDFPAQDAHCLPTDYERTIPGIILATIDQPSESKSNRLHVEIFRFLNLLIQACSTDSSKLMGNFPEVFNFSQ
jgi:hypothetical protein